MAEEEVNIRKRQNSRGIEECYITGKHVSLQTLTERMLQTFPQDRMMYYLNVEMPPYPTPVEFWISNVAHVTVKSGFEEILESGEFRPPNSEFFWWGLKIDEEEIRAAENRYIEEHFPEVNEMEPFLETFTTSPPFKKESRYGNYRFTFPLTDLMQWYKKQNCGGEEPVLRVYETVTYKQEIMFTVLIHSPDDNERFGEYPLLEASEWVHYNNGRIIWTAQAICGTHEYQFVSGAVQNSGAHLRYYVWDHVSLVFHLPDTKSLKIPRERLIKALDACEIARIDLTGYQGPEDKKERFNDANSKVSELKRELEEESNENKTAKKMVV